ncbi:Epimerase family protein [Aliarcobacter thereius]|uniref:Epimerase family protein n=1 Tax=Aliarcobacter thereius TaxID=544718 RepID=A0A1C0B741_9BACT|nr:TIGR01777 family oxidoreductase [Aliarcobacter thereius]OCL86906.1 Epimerase family protein [Aliarcobacter thereius]OCL91087.1 Epimerase family protein [Aliarcobacter thereius]OCL99391.1 Epimerase family protein [Aliarcobacter thereius]HJE02308.1 TIGR01777 family oxidoreductase [Aliarcobacter thereius]
MKTILISGGSGFVGQSLLQFFENHNYKVNILSRETLNDIEKLDEIIEKSEVIINLSGANIINRWSKKYKEILYKSRINTTKTLVESIKRVENKPKLFISTSAVGIYDNKAKYDENGSFSNDFLSKLCQDWEKEAQKAKNNITKVAIFRLAIVLGEDGGAFKKMITPFKFGLGGVIGSGKQYFPYIHIEDLLSAYKFVIQNKFDGTFNLLAPNITTNYEFTKTLGKVLNRPTIFPIPEFILKIIFSEGAKVLSDGQNVVPKRLLDLGFEFKYKNIYETLKNLVK